MTETPHYGQSKPRFEPRPLQLEGMKLGMQHGGFRLFLKPGRGKTAVVLKVFDLLKKQGLVDVLLVVAPLRVVTTSWPHQLGYWQDFSHLTHTLIHGGADARRSALAKDVDVYLMNVEGLVGSEFAPTCTNPESKRKKYIPNPIGEKWFKRHRVMLAVDESTKFKNHNSLRSQSLKCYLPLTERRCIMTGTPRPGTLEDLFFQCYITDGGADLGRYITHFRSQYMSRSRDGFSYTEVPGAAERVAKKIAPTTLMSGGSDSDMVTEEVLVWVPMPPALRTQYNELKREFLLELGDSTIMAPNSGVLWGKLRQFAQGAIYDPDEDGWHTLHNGKLDALENLLEELGGDPAFCLYAYGHDYERISERLGYVVPRIGGGVSVTQGSAYCRLFSSGQLPLLLGHPASVALGVDGLQNNCSNVIWFGSDPSWEATYQANLRIARSGSKAEKVTIYRIVVDCCIERAILTKCSSKELAEKDFLDYLRTELTKEQ